MRQDRRVTSSSSITRRLAAIVGVLSLLVVPGTTASAARPEPAPWLPFQAPAPGYGLAITALTTDGHGLELFVETGVDGVTRVVDEATPASGAGVTSSLDACSDGRHVEIGFRWTRPWAWRFRASSTPTGMSKAAAETQLRAAVRSITTARNDCGRPDRVSARATYLGRTTRRPGVRSDAGCGALDRRNVVGFGNLPPYIAGVTCTTYTSPSHGLGQAIESDVLFNKRYHTWAVRRASCGGSSVILRAVATHEFGHVFGLGHVKESTHGNLTMSEAIMPCDDSPFTLGKGDVIGLERLY
jgi:hypothetical protein